MGTNFSFVPNEQNPLKVYGEIHLGKSSMGWSFSFHGYKVERGKRRVDVESGLSIAACVPGLWITNFAEVLSLIASGGDIVNEYGDEYSIERFVQMVADKKSGKCHSSGYPGLENWVDVGGHNFSGYDFC